MIRARLSRRARFWREQAGNATVEFVIVFPVFLALFLFSLELAIITLRHTMLERGLDIAVRELRLGTGSAPQHDDIKQIICDNAMVISSCDATLRLEMVRTNIRTLATMPQDVNCVDSSEEAAPVRQFENGQQNDLMLLRACVKYSPLLPGMDLAQALDKDGAGQVAIVSRTAFVQEPL
ncbi:TadE/TadG family type IV pilus assembly protein [Roseovarius sp. C7]|uniref:TadE/TadG family type IV pilus assembly protein n=1 Tax=Roseovarius sp. C7 TaxID=3398643 RepID=UPI0039F52CEF